MAAFIQDSLLAQEVARRIAPHSKLLRAWPLKGGISAEMSALEIETMDGETRKYTLRQPGQPGIRQNRQAAAGEFRLLEKLRSHGISAPVPVLLDNSCQLFPAPYLVLEYIDGRPEFNPPDLSGFLRQAADRLAEIHHIAGNHPDLAFLPRPAADLSALLENLPSGLDPAFSIHSIARALSSAWPIPLCGASVLLHGDYWPGNLLWKEDRLVAVIDWEDAWVGDPLFDLAIARLDLLWIFSREAADSFTNRYLSLRPVDDTHLPEWDLFAALRLARMAGQDLDRWAAFFRPFGRPDITPQTILNHYQESINRALAVLSSRI